MTTGPRTVHLVDGTYELFRHHFGQAAREASDGAEVGATRGVLGTLVGMLESGATHLAVATDHVVESFRNDLWPGYKTSEGMPPELLAQFPLVEEAVAALGVTLWAMVDVEADDALGSGAAIAAGDEGVGQVVICTPDKDLAQMVSGSRVVQLDRRSGMVIDEAGVWEKFGVAPTSIPDYLALVGDSADGFPGIAGWGKKSAATALAHYGTLDRIPDDVTDWEPDVRKTIRNAPGLAARLAGERELALLFRELATLRIDTDLVARVDDLRWQGPGPEFASVCRGLRAERLIDRVAALSG